MYSSSGNLSTSSALTDSRLNALKSRGALRGNSSSGKRLVKLDKNGVPVKNGNGSFGYSFACRSYPSLFFYDKFAVFVVNISNIN